MLCGGNTGTALHGLVGSALVEFSPAYLQQFPGALTALMSLVLGLMVACITSITMELGHQPGKRWVEFLFLLRLLYL